MNKEIILLDLQKVLCKVLKKDSLVIQESTTSKEVDGWDSLTHMLIVSEVEKHFGISFHFREIMNVKNVGEFTNLIFTKMQ